MSRYILRRIYLSLITILIVSVIIFLIIHLTPGDPASTILGMDATRNQIEELNKKLGLDKPLVTQYFIWFKNILKGDLGKSYFMDESVKDAILSHLSPTISLSIFAEIIALFISVPLSALSIRKNNKIGAFIANFYTIIGLALPSFIISLILLIIFSIKLKVLPVAGYAPLNESVFLHIKYLILPSIALGIGQGAYLTKIFSTQLNENLSKSYIKTAIIKGFSENDILFKEILRNSLIVMITAIGQSIGSLLAGAIVVETIFAIPGMGQLLINSIGRRDLILIQGIVLVISLIYIIVNLVIDVSYGLIDPRIRLGGNSNEEP